MKLQFVEMYTVIQILINVININLPIVLVSIVNHRYVLEVVHFHLLDMHQQVNVTIEQLPINILNINVYRQTLI